MERLTEYDEFGNAEFVRIDNTKLYERLVCDETAALKIATNKLGKLEDILEKYGIENLEEYIKSNQITKKAFKLACEELRVLNYITFDNADIDFEEQFKEQAEKEMKGE